MNLEKMINKISYEENTGLSHEKISEIEKKIDFVFPSEYEELLMKFDGGYGEIGEFYIDFWEVDDTLSYYEDNEEINHLILFASDGCGMAFAFEKIDKAIYSIPMDCLEKAYAKRIADDYMDFLNRIHNGSLEY